MGILCENSSIREYIKITLNKIENDLDLELQDRLMRNGPIYIYIYIYIAYHEFSLKLYFCLNLDGM